MFLPHDGQTLSRLSKFCSSGIQYSRPYNKLLYSEFTNKPRYIIVVLLPCNGALQIIIYFQRVKSILFSLQTHTGSCLVVANTLTKVMLYSAPEHTKFREKIRKLSVDTYGASRRSTAGPCTNLHHIIYKKLR